MRHTLLPLLILTSAITIQASSPTEWYEPTVENRPFVRWWWHGSAVDSTGITYNLEEFARAGIGGFEITPIYGVKGNEANDIPYLSDKWMDILGHTVSEARRLGLQPDMNNGTGWPFGGPTVTSAESARKLVTQSWQASPGTELHISLFPVEGQPDATLQRVVAVSPTGSKDLSDLVRDNDLTWIVPSGNEWKIYAIYSGRTYQKVKRAAPGGEGLVVNHYDSIAVRNYLSRFDDAFKGRETSMPDTFFNDSFEVHGSDWSDNILDEFKREHGYDLALNISEFLGDNGETPERKKLLHDYRLTLGRLLEENFTRVWTSWAHSHGARVRNQSHGSPANIIDLYADVDIPECESFGQTAFDIPGLHSTGPSRPSDAAPSVLKFASSAAHLAGKPLTSAESLTWLTEHFRTPLSRCKVELDNMFCSGVNHVYFHGATYSPEDAPWPGRLFYASINMSPTSSLWADAPELFTYITRIQSFLSAGHPDNDLLLYFPYEDIITRTEGRPFFMFAIHGMDKFMPDVREWVERIIGHGYDVDYLSDRLIDSLTVCPGGDLLSAGGNRYRAIIVPDNVYIPELTIKKFDNLARRGVKVIRLSELGSLSLPVEQLRRDGVSVIRRVNEVGGHNYFLSMLGNKELDGWTTLGVPAGSVMIFNPLTGEKGLAETRSGKNGTTEIRLQLRPGESLLLKTFPGKVDTDRWNYISRRGNPVIIDRGWSISFPESDPPVGEEFHTDTITEWTQLPVPEARTNRATGRYHVRFTLSDPTVADGWLLDLGDVRESARVCVNGIYAGTAWSVPMVINIGPLLVAGENDLSIDVTNLDANRIADYERRGVKWRVFKDANISSVTGAKEFSFGDWETVPSGLNSTVKLFPIYYN